MKRCSWICIFAQVLAVYQLMRPCASAEHGIPHSYTKGYRAVPFADLQDIPVSADVVDFGFYQPGSTDPLLELQIELDVTPE